MTAARLPKAARYRQRAETAWGRFEAFVADHLDSTWVFRGDSDNRFGLLPKIGRPFINPWQPRGKTRTYDEVRERAVLQAFMEKAPLLLPVAPRNPLEWMAVAQHHGLPTRLLDWTHNPLVAAWFACRRPLQPGCSVRVWGLKVQRTRSLDSAAIEGFDPFLQRSTRLWEPPIITERIASQRGCFTIHHQPDEDWTKSGDVQLDDELVHHDIESEIAQYFIRRLFKQGISEATLMPGLDGLAKTLEWQFNVDVGLGLYGQN